MYSCTCRHTTEEEARLLPSAVSFDIIIREAMFRNINVANFGNYVYICSM